MSSNFAAGALELICAGQNLWHKSPLRNDKVHFFVFFHSQIIFLHKNKVDGLKKFVNYMELFFWFDTFEGMPFFQG